MVGIVLLFNKKACCRVEASKMRYYLECVLK